MNPTRKHKLLFPTVAVGVAILVFLMLVWPTPYREADGGRKNDRQRVNRFTGKHEVYDPDKHAWSESKRSQGSTPGTGGTGYNGPDTGMDGADARRRARKGKNWWYEDAPGSKKAAGGDQWWYQEKKGAKREAPKDDRWWHD